PPLFPALRAKPSEWAARGRGTCQRSHADFLDRMSAARRTHPFVFLVLILPFGVMSGYLTVAVAYLLTKAGVSLEQIAELIAVSFIPQTWKFLWAPVAHTTLSR